MRTAVTMRVRPIAALVGLAIPAALAGAAVPAASGRLDAPTLSVKRAGLTAQATRGSFCMQPPPGDTSSPGICADSAYPLEIRGRLPVRRRGRVVLKPSVEASALSAGLLRVHGSTIEPVGGRLAVERLAPRRWAVRLPARLGRKRVLDVSLRWDNARDGRGDANFWAGLRRLGR